MTRSVRSSIMAGMAESSARVTAARIVARSSPVLSAVAVPLRSAKPLTSFWIAPRSADASNGLRRMASAPAFFASCL